MRTLSVTALAIGLAATVSACSSTAARSGTLSSDTLAPVPSTAPTPTATAPQTAPTTLEPTTTAEPTTTESTTTTTTIDPVKLAALEQDVLNQFEQRARKILRPGVAGVAVAIAHHGKVVGTITLGETSEGEPLTDDSKFRLASISKTLTAMTVMALIEQGKFELDDTLEQVWKGELQVGDPRSRDITVRQLLQHTSGMQVMREVFFRNEVADWHEAAKVALGSRLHSPPGGGYKYSNANYVILGEIIEQHTGTTAEQAAKDLVLAPLGITDAAFGTTRVTDLTGPGYSVSTTRNYMESLGPAGGWTMSAANVARVLGALQPLNDASPVDAPVRKAMRKAWAPEGQRANARYAIGLERFGKLWGHTGSLQSVRNVAFMLPNGYTVIVLTASNIGPRGVVLLDVFDSEFDAALDLPRH